MENSDQLTDKQKECLEFWTSQACGVLGWGHEQEYGNYVYFGGLFICCPEFMTDKEIAEYERLKQIYGKDDPEDTGELDEKICEEMFEWET
jgi:hypothetical protein